MNNLTEDQLINLAEIGSGEVSSKAMKQLRDGFDSAYMWCRHCAFSVVREKDCCLKK